MALGLGQFLLGGRHLSERSSHVPTPLTAEEKVSTLRKSALWAAVAIVFYAIVGFSGVYTLNWLLVPITVAGLVIPVLVIARSSGTRTSTAPSSPG